MTNKKEDTMSKLTKEQALAKIEELKKYVDHVDTIEEARKYCEEWNENHKPGKLSLKAEFRSV
jgi:hypothetical protein